MLAGPKQVERLLQLRQQLIKICQILATSTQYGHGDVELLERLLIGEVVVRGYKNIKVLFSSA